MPDEQPEHIVKSYGADLRRLADITAEMGGLVESQVNDAVTALVRRDTALAARVVESDPRVDSLQREIEGFAVRLLALRQPVGSDLRVVIATFKIAGDLERIGDYAANAAKRSLVLSQLPVVSSLNGFQRISRMVLENLKGAIDALARSDAEKAREVWRSDASVDEVYNGIFRELLTHMMEDPRNITAATHLLFIAKNLERVGDHATNIAELVYYAVRGEELESDRPKGDTSAFAVVRPRD